MREIEIAVPPAASARDVERTIDQTIAASGLETSLRGTLEKFPDSMHWHLKKPGVSGTLEITFWPRQHRAWFTIQSGRAAPWIDDELPRFAELLHQRLHGGAEATRGHPASGCDGDHH